MPNRPALTGNLLPRMPVFGSNASTHNIKAEQVLGRLRRIPWGLQRSISRCRSSVSGEVGRAALQEGVQRFLHVMRRAACQQQAKGFMA